MCPHATRGHPSDGSLSLDVSVPAGRRRGQEWASPDEVVARASSLIRSRREIGASGVEADPKILHRIVVLRSGEREWSELAVVALSAVRLNEPVPTNRVVFLIDRGDERPAADLAASAAEEVDPLQPDPVIGFFTPGEILIEPIVIEIGWPKPGVATSRMLSLHPFVGFNEADQ